MERLRFPAMLLLALAIAACATLDDERTFTLTVIGMNDVHGELVPKPDSGGIAGMSGFIDAVRAARAEDGGAVLVIDAGDMWQGTLESNLREGAPVVAAYNAMGVTAAAIGNHEFDFGPVGEKAIPESSADDPRGALKQRAAEVRFPLLAANIIDESTGLPVAWPNTQPSVIVDVQGIKVGIIGVLSSSGLITTIAANTRGVGIAPLAGTIADEARKLRDSGATIIIVTAHAGSRCERFDDPRDLSSCNTGGEIMRVAEALPPGLVDHIIGGHVHKGIAHYVNNISITSSYSRTQAFSRVDLMIDRDSGMLLRRKVYPPQQACLRVVRGSGRCATPEDQQVESVVYEGRRVTANPAVAQIAAEAVAYAEAIRGEKIGPYVTSAFAFPSATESPLANLMTHAVLESVDGDVAIHNVLGGIRNGLPKGDLTFGAIYEMFPFDNHVVVLDLSGAELRTLLAHQAHKGHRRAGIAGIRVQVRCSSDGMRVVATRPDGTEVDDDDRVRLIANDFLVLGGDDVLTPIIPDAGIAIDLSMPLVRDVLVDWFRNGPETLSPDDFSSTHEPRWRVPAYVPESCTL